MSNIEDTQEIEVQPNERYDRMRIIYTPSKKDNMDNITFKTKVLEKLLREGYQVCKIPDVETIIKEQHVKPEYLFQYICSTVVLGEINIDNKIYLCLDFVLDECFDIKKLVNKFLSGLEMKLSKDIDYALYQ